MFHGSGLDEQHIAARLRHRQAGRHARDARALRGLEEEFGPAEVGYKVDRAYADRRSYLARSDLGRYLPEDLADFAFQVATPRLARVIGHDLPEGFIGEDHFLTPQAVALELAGHQVISRNGHLLVVSVPVNPDHFHAVEQWSRHSFGHVSGGDEKHFREVQVHSQVVVTECVVLSRIQYLE